MSPHFTLLCSDSSCTFEATTSSDGKGVKISMLMLVPKAGATIPCGTSVLIVGVVLSSESGLVVRSRDGMGSVYSPSMSSLYEVKNMAS